MIKITFETMTKILPFKTSMKMLNYIYKLNSRSVFRQLLNSKAQNSDCKYSVAKL